MDAAAATAAPLCHPFLILCRQKLSRRRDDLLTDNLQVSFNQSASGAGVTTAAELLGELVDVDVASAAERDLDLVVAEIPEEECETGPADRAGMLGNSL